MLNTEISKDERFQHRESGRESGSLSNSDTNNLTVIDFGILFLIQLKIALKLSDNDLPKPRHLTEGMQQHS